MEMQIDFYSKKEMAIAIDTSERPTFSTDDACEMFLFAAFTLRQMSNLGQHPVTQCLAGILVNEEHLKTLIKNDELPNANNLLTGLRIYSKIQLQTENSVQEILRVSNLLDSQFNYNDAILEAIDSQLLSNLPEFVEPEGHGKRYFKVTIPPLKLKAKGFGFLGKDVNFHAFHSVIGLIRFLGDVNSDEFRNNLFIVAKFCGDAFIHKKNIYD